MVDFRQELRNIINDYGVKVLITNKNKKTMCNCIDTLTQSAQDKCPICIGSGYITQASICKTRIETVSSGSESLDVLKSSIGSIYSPIKYFYLEYDSQVDVGSLIVLCNWNGEKPVVSDRLEIYNVTYVDQLFGENGRVEFLKVSAYRDQINQSLKLHTIINNIGRSKYYLGVG